MPATTVRQRSEVPVEFTWNAPSVFPTREDWQAEAKALSADIPQIQAYQGRLGEGAGVLLEGIHKMEALYERTGKVQFPYLIDPNTGAGMFESAAIVDYLETRYAR